MQSRYLIPLLSFSAVLMISAGLLTAQTTTPEATPEATPEMTLTCDLAELIVTQAELAESLQNFAQDVQRTPGAALDTLYDVGARYQALALECGYLPEDFGTLVIGETPLDRVMSALDGLSGDPLRGQLLYNGEESPTAGTPLGCSGCHNGVTGPATEGTWTRWDEIHSQEAIFSAYTFERYTAESILYPNAYTVDGYQEGMMPAFYHQQLSYQDLVDIIAYLGGQDQFLDE